MANKKNKKKKQHEKRLADRKKNRDAKRRKKQQWKPVHSKQANKKPQPAPSAAGYLMRKFWEFFKFDKVLEGFEQIKHKGLPLSSLYFLLMLFGVMNAASDANLFDKVNADPLLVEMLGLELLEKQQFYRTRKRLSEDQYDEWLKHTLEKLQEDPRTASRSDGVVIGDDSVMIKTGKNMPDITIVYKSSEGYYGLGYAMPTTHYADEDKDYPLFGRLHYRSEDQKQEAEDRRLRRRKKLDGRSLEDEIKWMDELVSQERRPEVVILRGTRLCSKLTNHCEDLNLGWIGISAKNRKYILENGKDKTARELLKTKPKNLKWKILNDEGIRMAWLNTAESNAIGTVSLALVDMMSEGERMLCVMSKEMNEDSGTELLKSMLNLEKGEPDKTKLHDMLELLKKSSGFIRAETAVFDRWFHVPWFIGEVLEISGLKRVIIKAKANRSYTMKGMAGTWEELEKEIKKYERQTVSGRDVYLARLKVSDPDIGAVQLVFVKEINIRRSRGNMVEEIGQCYALMCTDPKFKAEKVFQAHKLRWKIEEFYREARQNHGLGKFHCRDKDAIQSHIVFSFMSWICTALCRMWNTPLKDKTLGWIKRNIFQRIVKLKHQGGKIIVCFDKEWIELYGLPDLYPPPLAAWQ